MNTVLVGAQWGDEGKGKVIDFLTEESDVVVRFQGGSNAGHTVVFGDKKYVLHLVPSGILHNGKHCVIGNGVVMDPFDLMKELEQVESWGFELKGRFHISERAQMVMQWHRAIDKAEEAARPAGKKIGTTGRGIGPAYAAKVGRYGMRVGDILRPNFLDLVRDQVEEANRALKALGAQTLDADEMVKLYTPMVKALMPYVTDTIQFLHENLEAKKSLLFEGAQATMLDIDFGTYPFVTSSNPTAGGACTGYKRMYCFFYTTFPADLEVFNYCEPVYEEMPGWQCETSKITDYAALPENAKAYINRILDLVGGQLGVLSVDPAREKTLRINI